MRILICDDDKIIVNELQELLLCFFESNHLRKPCIVSYFNGIDLLRDNGKIDLLFLDIEMPGLNGIHIGKEIKKQNKNTIIFIVTSYTQYLDDAMRFHVFRYLSKPLDKQRFFRNMNDALALYHTLIIKVPIETKEGLYVVPSSSIIAVEAQSRKVIIHTLKQDYVSIHNMSYWADYLPHNCFFQTHRSFIVNFAHIKEFSHNLISLTGDHLNAYLTRRKYTMFKEAYLLYLESTR